MRAIFEMCLHKHWPLLSAHVLTLSLQLERQQWATETPLRQCGGELNYLILEKLDQRNLLPEDVREMDVNELGTAPGGRGGVIWGGGVGEGE